MCGEILVACKVRAVTRTEANKAAVEIRTDDRPVAPPPPATNPPVETQFDLNRDNIIKPIQINPPDMSNYSIRITDFNAINIGRATHKAVCDKH